MTIWRLQDKDPGHTTISDISTVRPKKLLSQSQEIRNGGELGKQNHLLSFYCVTGFCDTETETSDKIKNVT